MPEGAIRARMVLADWLRLAASLALLAGAACQDEYDEGDAVPWTPYWVFIDPADEVVTTSSVDLYGIAYCDACPPAEVGFGFCPPVGGPYATGVDVLWANVTTGDSGGALHGISGHCSCLFSYCTVSYEHAWWANVPLALGPNEIELVCAGPAGDAATDTVTITRVPPAPVGLRATGRHGGVALSWAPVSAATSYELVWSTSPNLDLPGAARVTDVTSPCELSGIEDGVTIHLAVIARAGGYASPRSDTVWATAGWATEDVLAVDAGWSPVDVAIALNSLGRATVFASSGEFSSLGVRDDVATETAGGWVLEAIGPATWWDADVAAGSSDAAHLTYMGSGGLKHVTRELGAWVSEAVDPAGWCDSSLALDALDRAHCAYRVAGSVRYSVDAGGGWSAEDVDTGDVGCSPEASTLALAVEPDGTPHVLYRGTYPGYGARHAVKRAGTWDRSTVAQGYVQGLAIAVAGTGAPRIAFCDGNGALRVARPGDLDAWTVEALEDAESARAPSIALDADGRAHVSFVSAGELRVASETVSGWRVVRIAPASGADTAIALDPQGAVQVAFFDGRTVRRAIRR